MKQRNGETKMMVDKAGCALVAGLMFGVVFGLYCVVNTVAGWL